MAIIVDQQLIRKLQELSANYAVEALKRPVNKDSFEYGEHCGVIKGIAMAEELILKLLNGEESSERKRPTNRNGYQA